MAEQRSLKDTLTEVGTAAAPNAAPAPGPAPGAAPGAAPRGPRRADRVGRRVVSVYVDEAVWRQLKIITIERETTLQDVVEDAILALVTANERG